MPPISVDKVQKSRKERRKEERLAKKEHLRYRGNTKTKDSQPQQLGAIIEQIRNDPSISKTVSTKNKNIGPKRNVLEQSVVAKNQNVTRNIVATSRSNTSSEINGHRKNINDPYSKLDPNTAAALRRDDEEIAMLEAKLGKASKDKQRLKREYAKLEGYGNDFGDFLDDLDVLVQNVVTTSPPHPNKYKTLHVHDDDDNSDNSDSDDFHRGSDFSEDDDIDDAYPDENSSDEEADDIFDDDGDDDDIEIEQNVHNDDDNVIDEKDGDDCDINDDDEEIIPMKSPTPLLGVVDNNLEFTKSGVTDFNSKNESSESHAKYKIDDEYNDDDASIDEHEEEVDHDVSDIYQPSKGEDIYGNIIDSSTDAATQPQKYVPPHLRKTQLDGSIEKNDDDPERKLTINSEQRQESLRELQRLLNSSLNRLSEATIASVVQTISQIYVSHPTADVNEALWVHTQNSILNDAVIMIGLIPVYVSALVGVHIQIGDSAQLMEYLLEQVVTKFWTELQRERETTQAATNEDEEFDDVPVVSKGICNLALIICYMYNFNVVHCTLIYDIIRHLIEYCYEVDVEILLLLINHCGRTLRSDDPNALKEIISLVQEQSMDDSNKYINTSRNQFMIDTLLDIKKHKRRKQDQSYADQTLKLRKILGHIKTTSIASSNRRTSSSDSSLRISLRDILDVNTKGRWWKVGASWAGSDPSLLSGKVVSNKFINHDNDNVSHQEKSVTNEFENDKLLQLAAKYRMNTDIRRTIFCILMGAADYEDCFEKLVRAGMLKNRSEREVVRVIMECCGNESTFNPFYAHLSARICEYQLQCRFTFQLAYWDTFKLLHECKPRKIASLAKLLFHLVAIHRCLKLNVIKTIDIGEPEALSEDALLFVTIFLSSILEHFDKPEDTFRLFEKGIRRKSGTPSISGDDDMYDRDDGMGASFTIFMVQILKASPKYQKGSKFRSNLKAAIKACDTNNFF